MIKNNGIWVKALCNKLSDYAINASDNDNMTMLNCASLSSNQEIIDDVSSTKLRLFDNSVTCFGLFNFNNFEEF